mgnify:CR=1 FL=1
MKFRVFGSRTIHFEMEMSASSYKDLESKLKERDTMDFYIIRRGGLGDEIESESTTLDVVVRVKDGRTWEDGFLTHTSEGVKSSGQKRNEHLKSFYPYNR